MSPALARALELHQPNSQRLPQFPTPEEAAAARELNKVRASILDDEWPKKVAAFRSLFSLARHDGAYPHPLLLPRLELHMRLLQEEYLETQDASRALQCATTGAEEAAAFAEWTDGILDLIYVGLGALLEAGFSPQQVNTLMTEVHASNLTKVDDAGAPIYDEGGKVLKGSNYVKADIAALIASFVAEKKDSN